MARRLSTRVRLIVALVATLVILHRSLGYGSPAWWQRATQLWEWATSTLEVVHPMAMITAPRPGR